MSVEFVVKPIGVVLGTAYPFYASFKALDSKSSENSAQWLTYWCVLAILSTAEYFLSYFLNWFQFYYTLKVLLVLWLQLPQTKGAMVIYWKLIYPQVKKHEDKIDLAVQVGGKRVQRIREQFSQYAAPTTVINRGSSAAVEKVLQELEEGDVGEKGE